MRTSSPPRPAHARHPDLDSLYCINEDGSRNQIQMGDVRGRYQTRKKIVWAVLIAIYVALPWIGIGGKPAILIDIAHRHFYLFGNTFNAQDFYLAFFFVTGIGFTLFVVSALFGRIWCGYSCPHTVFLDGVFRRIERVIEGNATQRKKLSESQWNLHKIARRGSKWAAYLAVSLFLSHTFLSYFMPVDEVFRAILSPPSANPAAFTFILIFTAIIYFNFAWFREQLCIVICPYGRLQGVLYDGDTINVGYDEKRGEPRGKYTKEARGDCIDCYRCVAVCPTGIDIRNGTQMECIGCANCVDACDEVMQKLGQPKGLIRYDSLRGLETGARRFLRPRVLMYAVLCLVGGTVFSVAAFRRTPFEATVLRLQGAPYTIEAGKVRNGFLVHLVNKQPARLTYRLEIRPQDGVSVILPVASVTLDPLADQVLPFFVEVERPKLRPGMTVELVVRTTGLERVVEARLVGPSAQ